VTCPVAVNDGAYILGSLCPSDRAEFERHLSGCEACRQSVASLAVLPGLLGRLDADSLAPSITAPATLLPRVLATMTVQRRAAERTARVRRRWISAGAVLAAASLAAVVGVGVHVLEPSPTGPEVAAVVLTSMQPVSSRVPPVTAEVGLVEVTTGTRVEMRCRYSDGRDGTWTVRLVVVDHRGVKEQIGTWVADAGAEIAVSGVTHLTPTDIARVELQREDHRPLLVWNAA
jgi:hypothetical protein